MFNRLTSWFFPEAGRIFVNYRRNDTQWAAGRLADSLTAYFDDDRVFRDIDNIVGGDDFTAVLDETLDRSDALIAVIGRDWLADQNEDGTPRIQAEDDWVAQEIAAALSKGMRVYPVLIDGAQMPTRDVLPIALQDLASKNAVTLTDERWDDDVTRLARIVGLDIPSATKRKLTVANWTIVLSLWVSIGIVMSIFGKRLTSHLSGDWFRGDMLSWFRTDYQDACVSFPTQLGLIPSSLAVGPYIVIAICSAYLFVVLGSMDRKKKILLRNAALAGGFGALSAFILGKPVCTEFEPTFMFLYSVVIIIVMLGFMSLSGFQSRQ